MTRFRHWYPFWERRSKRYFGTRASRNNTSKQCPLQQLLTNGH